MTSGEVTIDVDRQAILRGADRLTAGYGRGVGRQTGGARASDSIPDVGHVEDVVVVLLRVGAELRGPL